MKGVHPLYIAMCAFWLLAPLSSANEIASSSIAKWARVAVTVLIVLVMGPMYRALRTQSISRAMLVFNIMFASAALWSTSPVNGIIHKSLYVLTFTSGTVLAYGVRHPNDIRRGLRMCGTVLIVTSGVVAWHCRNEDVVFEGMQRLSISGINANGVGATAAWSIILLLLTAVGRVRTAYRVMAFIAMSVLAGGLLMSGSRGAVLIAVIGCTCVFLPQTRSPARLMMIAVGMVVLVWIAQLIAGDVGIDRVTGSLTKDTRSAIWSYSKKLFASSPFIGIGWINNDGSWGTVQSVYWQVAVEAGMAGIVMYGSIIMAICVRIFHNRNRLVRGRTADLGALALALIVCSLCSGIFESSGIVGTTTTPLVFGFGIGLLERFRELERLDSMEGNLNRVGSWVCPPKSELG